jgi:tetratricopeptide (TPR) repeat protein
LSLDPTHTDAAISLSVLYNDIGHYEDAKKIFNQANERVKTRARGNEGIEDQHVNKKFALKHLELGDLYMTYNRFDEALFEFNKVVALDTESLETRIKIAKVYAKKGFVSKAIEELKSLRLENPSYSNARIALGVLQYGNGNILEAQLEWEKVVSLEPHNSEAAMYLNLSKTATETSL